MAAFFSAFGAVCEFKIVVDPVTGASRGFGFVAFEHVQSADTLKAMRTIDFFGRTVRQRPAAAAAAAAVQRRLCLRRSRRLACTRPRLTRARMHTHRHAAAPRVSAVS